MKNGIYIAFEFEYKNNLEEMGSIEKKIYYQINTLEKYGYNIQFYNPYTNRSHSTERIFRRLPFHYKMKWDFDYDCLADIDFIYIRKQWYMDGDLIMFLKKVKQINSHIFIVVEIPTFPYDKEGRDLDMIPLKLKDKKWRKHLYKYVNKIVTYSNDKEIFNVKTINIVNAIDYETCKRNQLCERGDNSSINIIACASLYYWHGFDRAIYGLSNYYKNKRDQDKDIYLYIVGIGEEYKKLKNIVEELKLDKYVTFTGFKTGKELDDVYNLCEIGLDSMGRHRSGVFYNSSLKGKEYCAKGLFIVSGVKTELDKEKDYQYYYRIPADETPVDFKGIIEAYNKIIENKGKIKVQNEIMSFAKNHFDYSVAMEPLHREIENYCL